jgi:hypothetical protein
MSEVKELQDLKSISITGDGTPMGTIIKNDRGEEIPLVQSLTLDIDARKDMSTARLELVLPVYDLTVDASSVSVAKANRTQKDPELENRYSYHTPKGDQVERYAKIRASCLELAYLIKDLTPRSREQAVAFTHLDEVMYNANAAIARNE